MPALMPRNPHRNAPEYADRVNLIKKIKIGKIWTFAPVVPEANGRLKDKVRVNGQVEVHTEGAYYIEWWESGRRRRGRRRGKMPSSAPAISPLNGVPSEQG